MIKKKVKKATTKKKSAAKKTFKSGALLDSTVPVEHTERIIPTDSQAVGDTAVSVPELNFQETELQKYFRNNPHKAKAIYDNLVNNTELKVLLDVIPGFRGFNSAFAKAKMTLILDVRAEWL